MTSHTSTYHVYVGTYGDVEDEAIQLLEFNPKDECLTMLASATGIKNPSYLTVNKGQNRLYAVSEIETGEVVSFDIDLNRYRMMEMNRQPTAGNGPCYVTLDAKEEQLFTVNYGEGTMTTHPLRADGSLAPLCDVKTYKGERRSHPHTVFRIPGVDKYMVTDLGLSKLYLYEFDARHSKLELVNEISAVPDSGPRHIAIEPSLRRMYVVNELDSSISVYAYDETVENFELVQHVHTLPPGYKGENYCADIHIAQSKSFLYASNRGHHSIAVFRILEDGTLTMVEQVSTRGAWPRNFAITPDESHMLVANEHTNSIVIMRIDQDGIPQPTDDEYIVKAPVCLQIL